MTAKVLAWAGLFVGLVTLMLTLFIAFIFLLAWWLA